MYDDLLFVWEAFIALSSLRHDLESINFSEIESWLNLNGVFNLEYRQEVAHLVRVMDLKYIEFMRKKYAKK